MVNKEIKLNVLHDDNGTFLDYSNQAVDFARDSFSATFISADDFLYIGYYKPISTIYISMETASTTDTNMTVSYYNGSSFVAVSDFYDETKALQRDGFVQWDRNQSNEDLTTVNSLEKYWYRVAFGADTSAVIFKGINIVFSDDQDIKKEFFEYEEFLPTGETTFLLNHVSARDEIIQHIRNSGRYKQNQSSGRNKDINAFDVHKINQLNKASTYLVLSNIFANVLSDPDGLYREKQSYYRNKYTSAMDLFYLDLDTDDDGISDRHEEMRDFTGTVVRR
jgi:hypothetical protein